MGQNRFDIHSHITQSTIAAIESGPGEFCQPLGRPATPVFAAEFVDGFDILVSSMRPNM